MSVPALVDHLFRHEAARMTAEASDIIGGFYTIDAKSYDDAVSIASGCPHVKYSGRIEVREVDF